MESQPLNMTKNSFTEGFEKQSAFAKSLNAFEEKLQELGDKLKPYGETVEESLSKAFQSLPENVQQSLKSTQGVVHKYYHTLSSTSTQELIDDLIQFRVTPATVTLVVTTLTTILVASRLLAPAGKAKQSSKHKHKKKKQSKAQKANKEIQAILDFVEETYVPQIDEFLEKAPQLSKDEQQNKYNYFEEMLLVELMKLDDVNVVGNDVLRANRKKVIQFIQDHQKRLDSVKKSLDRL